jgi:hypothetical protein
MEDTRLSARRGGRREGGRAGARGRGFCRGGALGLAARHATDSEFAWILEGSLVFVRTGKPGLSAGFLVGRPAVGQFGDPGPGFCLYGHRGCMGFSPAPTLSLLCLPPWMKFASMVAAQQNRCTGADKETRPAQGNAGRRVVSIPRAVGAAVHGERGCRDARGTWCPLSAGRALGLVPSHRTKSFCSEQYYCNTARSSSFRINSFEIRQLDHTLDHVHFDRSFASDALHLLVQIKRENDCPTERQQRIFFIFALPATVRSL